MIVVIQNIKGLQRQEALSSWVIAHNDETSEYTNILILAD